MMLNTDAQLALRLAQERQAVHVMVSDEYIELMCDDSKSAIADIVEAVDRIWQNEEHLTASMNAPEDAFLQSEIPKERHDQFMVEVDEVRQMFDEMGLSDLDLGGRSMGYVANFIAMGRSLPTITVK